MKAQLVLPLESDASYARENFVVGTTNADAAAFVDSWPDWHIPAVAIHGPAGSGKSHLVAVWRKMSGAAVVRAAEIASCNMPAGPVVVEDVDSASAEEDCALRLFHLLERASAGAPTVLTGREHPSRWPWALPDLGTRFCALPALAIGPPDDALLAAIARKLFADRQLAVPETVIDRILRAIERSPTALREFIKQADRAALAESRPITPALVAELLAQRDQRLS